MDRSELAKKIYGISHITGEFRLRSGQLSNEYFDKYLFEGQPEVLHAIAEQMRILIPEGIEALAGLEMGGIPVVTMLSQVSGLPALFVRKKAKDYGTCNLAEGGQVAGRNLLIIEDVVTSGGQILLSAADLRKRDAVVEDVLCVIDRESGGLEMLAKEGLRLHSLLMPGVTGAQKPRSGFWPIFKLPKVSMAAIYSAALAGTGYTNPMPMEPIFSSV